MIEKPVWPEPDMSLFEPTTPRAWRANARMDHRLDWGLYILGYKEATNLLLQHTASGRDQDTLIYPILFNARQAIELGLKEIIRLGDRLLNLDDPYYSSPLPLGHQLRPLWDKAKDRIARVEASFDPEPWTTIITEAPLSSNGFSSNWTAPIRDRLIFGTRSTRRNNRRSELTMGRPRAVMRFLVLSTPVTSNAP